MRLIIPKDKYDYSFVHWLLNIIKYLLLRKLPQKSLVHFDSMLSVDVKKLFHDGIQALHIKELKDSYIIEIHPSTRFKGTSVTVADLCKMVSYGSLDCKGYTLFGDVFNFVSVHLSEYYDIYLHEYYI